MTKRQNASLAAQPDQEPTTQFSLESAISRRLGAVATALVSPAPGCDDACLHLITKGLVALGGSVTCMRPLLEAGRVYTSIKASMEHERATAVSAADELPQCVHMVDNTVPTSFGCPTIRLGADVSIERLPSAGDTASAEATASLPEPLWAISVARGIDLDAIIAAAGLSRVELDATQATALDAALSLGEKNRRRASDNAQVLAAFLLCHPRVERVLYPGIKSCDGYVDASSELVGGFGPCVDVWVRGVDTSSLLLSTSEDLANTSKVSFNARKTKVYAVNDSLLRVICGTENPDQIVMRLEQLLAKPQVDALS